MSDDFFKSLKIIESTLNQSQAMRQIHSTAMQMVMEQADIIRRCNLPNNEAVLQLGNVMQSSLSPVLERVRQETDTSGATAAVLGMANAIQTPQIQAAQNIAQSMQPVVDAFSAQQSIVNVAALSFQTPAISNLLAAFQQQKLTSGMDSFLRTISESTVTEAANIAFLKNISKFAQFDKGSIPYGWKRIINGMDKGTAEKISQTGDIDADIKKKKFVAGDVDASVAELNVICSATDVFEDITERELMRLMNVLESEPAYAFDCVAGKKIKEIIESWNTYLDFDCEYFYHGRSYEKGTAPYTAEDMKRAPRNYVGPGRFNYAGSCHYYFANTPYGAKYEIQKHDKNAFVQTAKLKPIKKVKLIDLSGDNKKIKFLEYIRFEADDTVKMPREYYIPQFVSSCCKHTGIEGIKYFGSKEYNNYVTWNDGYFEVADMYRDEEDN